MLRSALGALLALALCLVWVFAHAHSCTALTVPLLVSGVIALGLRETALTRRRILAQAYFTPDRWPHALARSPVLPSVFAGLLGLLLGLALCVELARFSPAMVIALASNAAFFVVLMAVMDRRASPFIEPAVRRVVLKRWAVGINSVVAIGLLVILALYSPVPAYVEAELGATLKASAAIYHSDCVVTDAVLQVATLKDATGWWFMVQAELRLGDGVPAAPRLLAWALFLVTQAMAAVGFSWLVVELMDRLDRPAEDA